MCYLKFHAEKKNLFKTTNLSLLFRSFVSVKQNFKLQAHIKI